MKFTHKNGRVDDGKFGSNLNGSQLVAITIEPSDMEAIVAQSPTRLGIWLQDTVIQSMVEETTQPENLKALIADLTAKRDALLANIATEAGKAALKAIITDNDKVSQSLAIPARLGHSHLKGLEALAGLTTDTTKPVTLGLGEDPHKAEDARLVAEKLAEIEVRGWVGTGAYGKYGSAAAIERGADMLASGEVVMLSDDQARHLKDGGTIHMPGYTITAATPPEGFNQDDSTLIPITMAPNTVPTWTDAEMQRMQAAMTPWDSLKLRTLNVEFGWDKYCAMVDYIAAEVPGAVFAKPENLPHATPEPRPDRHSVTASVVIAAGCLVALAVAVLRARGYV